MQFNISFDQAIGSLPSGFVAAINYVVRYFDHLFTDPITINIDVGYGEVNSKSLSSGALGESVTYLNSYSYSAIKSALTGDATSPADATAIASLPGSDPISSTHTYWVSTAEQKALGLLAANSAAIDGYVGFSNTALFDYNRDDGISTGFYDFIGVVEHEFSEVMGRVVLVGETIGSVPNGFEPLDLFDYSSAGVRRLVGTTPGYFSINGGTTKLDNFNTNPGGDFGDWAASAGNDSALAFSSSGVMNVFSPTDVLAMDVLGYDRSAATVADFNGDGMSDILWRNSTDGSVGLWEINSNQLLAPLNISGPVGSNWQIAATGDFNGDHMIDILWRNSTDGSVGLWEMNGNQLLAPLNISGPVASNWQIAGTGDFNGDGKSDILWRNSTDGSVGLWEMNGNQLLAPLNISGPVASNWQIAGTGDFNGDGMSDILWRNSTDGSVGLWEMNGNQLLAPLNISGPVASNWQIVATGDFNGDGMSDILWRNSTDGSVGLWEMNGNQLLAPLNISGPVASNWQIVATGDFNGDGMSDILWRNSTDGSVRLWEMNGSQMLASLDISGPVASNWKIFA